MGMKIAFRRSGIGYTGYKRYTNVMSAWWTVGEFTHSELIFSDGVIGSAWFDTPGMTNGVHLIKRMQYDPKLWEIVDIHGDEARARRWFEENLNKDYSLIGALSNVIRPLRGSEDKFFCSQAIAAALGWKDPWRYDPNLQHAIVTGVTNIVDKDAAAIKTVLNSGFKKGKAVVQNGEHGHQYVLESIGTPIVQEENMDTQRDQMNTWLDLQPDKVTRNVKIVTPEDLKQDHLFHISTDTTIRKFVPLIGRRQMKAEDRSIPRVCTAPSLLGCFIGYGQPSEDFLNLKSNGDKNEDNYKGGWKIYRFPFGAALRPNSKLVPDVEASDEMWLTLYSPETTVYVPETAGKVFYHAIRYVARSGKTPESTLELYAEITAEPGVPFSKNIFLSPGYWKVSGPTANHCESWKDDKEFVAEKIEKGEYLAAKNASAGLLSLPETLPPHQTW